MFHHFCSGNMFSLCKLCRFIYMLHEFISQILPTMYIMFYPTNESIPRFIVWFSNNTFSSVSYYFIYFPICFYVGIKLNLMCSLVFFTCFSNLMIHVLSPLLFRTFLFLPIASVAALFTLSNVPPLVYNSLYFLFVPITELSSFHREIW